MLPPSKQPIGLADVRAVGDLRAGDRPDDRRLAHRHLRLAVRSSTSTWCPGAMMLAALVYRCRARRCSLACCATATGWASRTLAIGLAALQTVLEEGNKDDWFGSPFIVRLSRGRRGGAGAVHLSIELTRRSRWSICACCRGAISASARWRNFMLGLALYGSVYLLPQLSVADAGLQRAADRRGDGLDRAAAACDHPVRAAADAPVRCAAAGRRRPWCCSRRAAS